MPHATAGRHGHYKRKDRARFVHYTSAEAALNIIKSKHIWMRNSTCMSDYSEVRHGFDSLNKFFRDNNGANKIRFIRELDDCIPNVAEGAFDLFNQWWKDIQSSTYIASISEHQDKEDPDGRLSMWRAYGGNSARVAIVFNIPWSSSAAEDLSIMFNPVAYLKEDGVDNEINAVIDNIKKHRKFLRGIGSEMLGRHVFNMFIADVTCLKHESFNEEREWRILHFPKLWSSPHMKSATETISGIPQLVYKLPLDASLPGTPAGLDITCIFERLIIGPSPYSSAQYEAFVNVLKEVGVSNAEELVFRSATPIRT